MRKHVPSPSIRNRMKCPNEGCHYALSPTSSTDFWRCPRCGPIKAPGAHPGREVERAEDAKQAASYNGPLFGGPPQLHRNPEETEVEAADRIAQSVSKLRREVYLRVRAAPAGLAAFEVCDLFPDRTPYSIRPRLTELCDRGLLAKGGKRPNHRGNNEVVWIAAPTPTPGTPPK